MGQYMSRTRRTRSSQLPRNTAYNATPSTMGAHTPTTTHVLIAGDTRAPPVTLKRSRTQDPGGEDEEGDKAQIKKRRVENTYYQVVGDLKHTSEYMFTQLFENGVGSDVCITALGHSWHLHKVLLRQSKFFDCMFSGRWADDSDSNVTLTIDDPNIDVAALSTCFASMYGDSIVITVDGLISLVASATLLQLDNVLDRCLATAKGSLDSSNVLTLYEAARMYGMTGIETLTVDYLSSRILLYAEDTHMPPINWLLGLDAALMQRLVASSALWVFTVELDVYSLCCMWMYAQIERDTIEEYIDKTSSDDCSKLFKGWSEEFFSSWAKENKDTAFLNSEIGQRYIPVFRALRLEHVINAIEHLGKVETDAIISRDWVQAAVYNCWSALLKQGQVTANLSPEQRESCFQRIAIRCGKKVVTDRYSQWRWAGYYCATDLVLSFNPAARNISLQRLGVRVDATPFRRIHYRLRLMALDESGQVSWVSEANCTVTLDMLKTRIYPIATVPETVTAALYISFTVLLESPVT